MPTRDGSPVTAGADDDDREVPQLNLPMPASVPLAYAEFPVLPVDVPHRWLCEGRLLVLENSAHPNNLVAFQHCWLLGQVGARDESTCALFHVLFLLACDGSQGE